MRRVTLDCESNFTTVQPPNLDSESNFMGSHLPNLDSESKIGPLAASSWTPSPDPLDSRRVTHHASGYSIYALTAIAGPSTR